MCSGINLTCVLKTAKHPRKKLQKTYITGRTPTLTDWKPKYCYDSKTPQINV